MPIVSFIRPELAVTLPKYKIIRDCLAGSEAIKCAGTLYLPMPNASDKSKENRARYEAYKKRAVFYNATNRTLQGMVGQVFMREPVSEIPDQMDIIEDNATGSGVTLEQTAKKTLAFSLSYGRSGLYVDYPFMEVGATVEQIQSGEVRPTISTFDPMSIINWRTVTEGAVTKLSLVVLAEAWPFHDDGFEIKTALQFRVLTLNKGTGNYNVEIWREPQPTTWAMGADIPTGKNFALAEGPYEPKDAQGQPFKEIPFLFVGSQNNDVNIDNPPLYDLADLNVAHYRNSADYEEACYMIGQPTYWFSGLTESWVDTVLKNKIQLGSTGGVMLPEGGQGGLLQPTPNTMCKEAMDAKEKQMIALGAKLVENVQVQQTATQSRQDQASETSILAAATKNVTAAYQWALAWCGRFMGIEIGDNAYVLNNDFQITQLSAQDRAELIKEWQSGAITFSEMRAVLRKAGTATEDDAAARSKINTEQAESFAAMGGANNETVLTGGGE